MNLTAMIDAVDTCIVAGSMVKGYKDGTGHAAQFHFPSAMVLHKKTNVLYVCDERNNAVRVIKRQNGEIQVSSIKCKDFESPEGLCIDYERDTLIVANSSCHVIMEFDLTDPTKYCILAGTMKNGGWLDGNLLEAKFKTPTGLTAVRNGCLYVCDTHNEKIRKIDRRMNLVTTIAGTSTGCFDGPCNMAKFSRPSSIRVDAKGNLIVADTNNHRLRYVDLKKNEVRTLAGSDEGNRDGPLEDAKFKLIYDFVIGKTPNEIWLCDSGNSRVKRIDLQTRQVQTIDNFLEQTYGIVLDHLGNLTVASYWHSLIYKIVLCRPLEWESVRLLWIGQMKEDPKTCHFAKLPRDVMMNIIGATCTRMRFRGCYSQ